MRELVSQLLPHEALHLACLQTLGHLAELLGKLLSRRFCLWQGSVVSDTLGGEEGVDGLEVLIDILQVRLQLVSKHREWLVDVEFQGIVDVLLHSLGTGEILDDAEWLLGTKQAVGA